MTNQTLSTDTESADEDANKGGKTAWILAGFFIVLITMNATFFAVAFSNPPEMHPMVDESAVPAVPPAAVSPGSNSAAPEAADRPDSDR